MLFGIDIDILVGLVIFVPMFIIAAIVLIKEARRIRKEERANKAEVQDIDRLLAAPWVTYDEHLLQHSPLEPDQACAHCYLAMLERQR